MGTASFEINSSLYVALLHVRLPKIPAAHIAYRIYIHLTSIKITSMGKRNLKSSENKNKPRAFRRIFAKVWALMLKKMLTWISWQILKKHNLHPHKNILLKFFLIKWIWLQLYLRGKLLTLWEWPGSSLFDGAYLSYLSSKTILVLIHRHQQWVRYNLPRAYKCLCQYVVHSHQLKIEIIF